MIVPYKSFRLILITVCIIDTSAFSAIAPRVATRCARGRIFSNMPIVLTASSSEDENDPAADDAYDLAVASSKALEDEMRRREEIRKRIEGDPFSLKETKEENEKTGNDGSRNSYPIDLPSPVLLSASMVLGFSSSGSLLDVVSRTDGSSPAIGVIPALLITVLGFPASLYLLYAAVKKGAVETEEDDAKFLSGK